MVIGKNFTLSINGGAIGVGFQVGQVFTTMDFARKFGPIEHGVQQLETLPRRERNWLAGYLEIKEQARGVSSPKLMRKWPVSFWRHLEVSAASFYEPGRRFPRMKGKRLVARRMLDMLRYLSGHFETDIAAIIVAYAREKNPTPADWRRIWTGE